MMKNNAIGGYRKMPDMICTKCKTEYHVCDEYVETYKTEALRCGCGEMMDVVQKKSKKVNKNARKKV